MGKTAKQCFYCSKECKKEYKEQHKKEYKYICTNCGKEIIRYSKKGYENCFCSKECEIVYHQKENHKEIFCEYCGKKLSIPKSSHQRFCGKECVDKWQSEFRRGENSPTYNHSYTKEQRQQVCEWCGEKFEVATAYLIGRRKFCTEDCRREWYARVWSQQKQWKKQSRIRAIQNLKDIPRFDTKPQQKIVNLLKQKNIMVETEYPCKYYSLDIYLPCLGLGIEIMGDFWHCNRDVYPQIKYQNQKERIPKDKRKRTYILSHYHIPILYIWESEIKDLDFCEALIDYYIKHNGEIPNYHSFNYSMGNGVLKVSPNPLKPYMEMPPKQYKKYFIS